MGSVVTWRCASSVPTSVHGIASRGLPATGVAATSWSAMACSYHAVVRGGAGVGRVDVVPLGLVAGARVVETGRGVIQESQGRRGAPGRDKRLTLDLLDAIAEATDGGQLVDSRELELRGSAPSELLILGWAGAPWPTEQVWRELRLLWDEGLIGAENTKTLADPAGKTSLRIFGLTASGWALLDELAAELRRPVRSSWLAMHRNTVIAAVGVAAAVLTAIAAFL
jgi:hypothetical protein